MLSGVIACHLDRHQVVQIEVYAAHEQRVASVHASNQCSDGVAAPLWIEIALHHCLMAVFAASTGKQSQQMAVDSIERMDPFDKEMCCPRQQSSHWPHRSCTHRSRWCRAAARMLMMLQTGQMVSWRPRTADTAAVAGEERHSCSVAAAGHYHPCSDCCYYCLQSLSCLLAVGWTETAYSRACLAC